MSPAIAIHRKVCFLISLIIVGVGATKLSDMVSSFYDKNDVKHTDGSIQLTPEQLSALMNQLQQQQPPPTKQGDSSSSSNGYINHHSTEGKSNRRKVLYDLSVRAHYEKLFHEQQQSLLDATTPSCEYYNEGMQQSSLFDVREIAKNDGSIFSRGSHWTFRLYPRKSLSQLHLQPSTLPEDDDNVVVDTNNHHNMHHNNIETLKLPPTSILSNSIHFVIPTVHGLGTYLPPWTPDYESYITAAWGRNEQIISQGMAVEYYIDGDTCQGGSRKRQSKVIYDSKCCERRRQSMIEELFQNDGAVMIRDSSEPEPCRYILHACNVCPIDDNEEKDEGEDEETLIDPLSSSTVDPSDLEHLLQTYLEGISSTDGALPPMSSSQIEANKQLLQSMFTHAYDSYFYNAFPASELLPLTCEPGKFDLVRVPALTLIDTLDTLILLGNYTEFARSVERLRYLDERMKQDYQSANQKGGKKKGEEGGLFSVDQNVSLFETTIRVLGGLLSAHQMANAFMSNRVAKSAVWGIHGDIINFTTSIATNVEEERDAFIDASDDNACMQDSSLHLSVNEREECVSNKNNPSIPPPTWEYDGFLLQLAHDIGKRLFPAFDTDTGIPYGTVNLLRGVPIDETPIASLAGAGTLTLEFELLSRLTGDQSFGKAAKLATRALWARGHISLNIYGKHIDAQSGTWKEHLSGVGSNSDSFYEYLAKHYMLFPDDEDFWTMFRRVYSGVHDNSRLGDWYVDVDLNLGLSGHVRQVFESLMAFYPGLQVLLGENVPSAKTLNSFFLVRELLGVLPERFNFNHWKAEGQTHPLRPELLESCYFLHLATIGLHGSDRGPCSNTNTTHHTSSWLWPADFALHAVHKLSWTPCGFATINNVGPTTTGGMDLVGADRDPLSEQKHYNIKHHNEMPSYFLSETIKYLYLIFDAENNILHNDKEREWIFTTEAHPIHYAPIPDPDNDNTLQKQIDKIRTMLNARLSTESETETKEAPHDADTNTITPPSLHGEKWAPKTQADILHADLHHRNILVATSKNEAAGIHEYESGPPFISVPIAEARSREILSSNIDVINQAHYYLDRDGKGSGSHLGKQCPNYHHPDLSWTIALGNSFLEYNTAHVSSVSDDIHQNDDVDERMLTALASVCFYGTDLYAEGIRPTSNSCPNEVEADSKANAKLATADNNIAHPSSNAPIPGSTRYDMGVPLGAFDVSSFPGGDGFVVRHVRTGELLEVSIFHSTTRGVGGSVILVVLTIPPHHDNHSTNTSQNKYSQAISSLTRRKGNSAKTEGHHEDYQRHVVVADLESNSFRCEVIIARTGEKENEDDLTLGRFACSPAFFGKAALTNIKQSDDGVAVKGRLKSPPIGDELGCKSSLETCPIEEEEEQVVQLVKRGECNFMVKASNQQHAEGVIVMNTNPDELFVMASGNPFGASSGDTSLEDELPVSVMVSGKDGDGILELLHQEHSQGNSADAYIHLKRDDDQLLTAFPFVKGSEAALQILASNGWGIHAVSQNEDQQGQQPSWQLFITQHDKRIV